MYITLLDDNDHTPVFTHQVFNTSVLESVPVSTSVIRLTATDGDTGRNAELEYTIISGDGRGMYLGDCDLKLEDQWPSYVMLPCYILCSSVFGLFNIQYTFCSGKSP